MNIHDGVLIQENDIYKELYVYIPIDGSKTRQLLQYEEDARTRCTVWRMSGQSTGTVGLGTGTVIMELPYKLYDTTVLQLAKFASEVAGG